jgi:hypothetical protein
MRSVKSPPAVAYRPRPVRSHGLRTMSGWTLKLYGIAASAEEPPQALMDAALARAADLLPSPPETAPGASPARYGIGFVTVHESGDWSYVLVCWWAEANEIHQRLLSTPTSRPERLRDHATPAIGCVWELAVTDHERRSWLRHVMSNPAGPDIEAYLEDQLFADV